MKPTLNITLRQKNIKKTKMVGGTQKVSGLVGGGGLLLSPPESKPGGKTLLSPEH